MNGEQSLIERVLADGAGADGFAAFRELVQWHQRSVFAFVKNLVHNVTDAEDIVQDVFTVAFQKLTSFDATRSKFSTWLLTIARNRSLNYLKRATLLTNSSSTDVELEVDVRMIQPFEVMLSSETISRLDAALESLPLDQRTAFVLAEIQQLPYAEIAMIEDVELGTIKSRVSRARQRLRDVLSDLNPAHRMQ